MSFSNVAENSILALILNAAAWANMADNAATTPQTATAVALATADPGDTGTMATNETTYTSYARGSVARTTGGWSAPTTGSSNLVANLDFAAGTGGTGTVTHMQIGRTGGGAVDVWANGVVTPNITVGNGITPRLTTATTISLD
jgi:hypothetical protein